MAIKTTITITKETFKNLTQDKIRTNYIENKNLTWDEYFNTITKTRGRKT